MREENERRNPELDDEALENVSGGESDDLVRNTERKFCSNCPHRPPNTCKGDAEKLTEYRMRSESFYSWRGCPFRPDA